MGKKMVIVESPAKAKTIGKILGQEYVVKSSMGHVRDLPVKRIGIDISNSFKPKYVVVQGRKKIIDALKSAANECDEIYLAPDPDREGEAIAWHLEKLLEKEGKRFFRVQYNEITPRAVRNAFEHPGSIDMNRVDAQQARRILDRIVGYMVSPILWRRLRRGLSAGRVQSVALRLLCEREQEIRDFVPEDYWVFGARARKLVPPPDPFELRLTRITGEKADIKNADLAERITRELEGRGLKVVEIATREIARRAKPPHVTSTLQQAASTVCGFSPKRTMSIAQKLYEGVDLGEGPVGLITYMRTDSFAVASEALQACRDLIVGEFGRDYCPDKPNFYKSRASAQEAHEAIRPTDVTRIPERIRNRLTAQEYRLYSLVWKRFVASQMMPARIRQRTVKVDAPPKQGESSVYTFQATASDVLFPGHLRVDGDQAHMEKEKEENGETKLPPLNEGEQLECLEWLSEKKETKPPPRYSEAALIRLLEQNGIGRPSTYAQIISTLHQRKYATAKNRTLTPTDLGMQVNAFLVGNLDSLFDVKFTASMEERLDEVEKGRVKWTGMLQDFYGQFEDWLEHARGPKADMGMLRRALETAESIREWAPEVKRGKRVYGDKRFVDSVARQAEQGKKPVSERQLNTLLAIISRYADQVPGIEQLLADAGYEPGKAGAESGAPLEATLRKLEILKNVQLDQKAGDFVDSLRARAESGRALSAAQLQALNSIVLAHAARIEGFEELRSQMGLEDAVVPEDNESGALLGAVSHVKTWREPVSKGRKTFDDESFFKSVSGQFERKGFLSPRQRAVLKRIVVRYKDQVPGYEEVAREFGLGKERRKDGSENADHGGE